MALTDLEIRTAKWEGSNFRLADDRGLYVLVKEVGKYFRLDYRFAETRKTLALGVYPLLHDVNNFVSYNLINVDCGHDVLLDL